MSSLALVDGQGGEELLPFVDRFTLVGETTEYRAWETAETLIRRTLTNPVAVVLARALGCQDVVPERDGLLREGAGLAGFRVGEFDCPHRLALVGEHRLARYAFIIELTVTSRRQVRFAIETRARFKGRRGSRYRRLVVESRFHAYVMRALLRWARHQAERP